eukprot:11206298-Lingulodinium_polyedra.AAC.1
MESANSAACQTTYSRKSVDGKEARYHYLSCKAQLEKARAGVASAAKTMKHPQLAFDAEAS